MKAKFHIMIECPCCGEVMVRDNAIIACQNRTCDIYGVEYEAPGCELIPVRTCLWANIKSWPFCGSKSILMFLSGGQKMQCLGCGTTFHFDNELEEDFSILWDTRYGEGE